MAGSTSYKNLRLLLDVSVTQLNAGTSAQSPITGSTTLTNSDIKITANSILSTQVNPGEVWDARIVRVTSPVDNASATNQYPDCYFTFYNGASDLQNQIMIDASYYGNMFPRENTTDGQRQVLLGLAMDDVLMRNMLNPGSVQNIPLLITGIKVTSSLTVYVTSTAGFGNNGSVVTPLRIQVYGEVYDDSDLAVFARGYNGTMFLNVPPSAPFVGVHTPAGPLSTKTISSYPGGLSQSGLRVYRRITYAYNNAATGTSNIFPFTQINSLQGVPANVVDPQHDLGDDFTQNNDVFDWQQFGLRLPANASAYVGFKVGSLIVPLSTQFGNPVSYHNNPYQYGQAQPQRASSDLYYAMPEATKLAKILVHKNAVVPFVSTNGLTSLAANTVSIAKSGVQISSAS